ncbi:hypothetical protein GCM10023334_097790 [Nonomuraea thailandensis]
MRYVKPGAEAAKVTEVLAPRRRTHRSTEWRLAGAKEFRADTQLDALQAAGVTRVFSEKISTRATTRPELDKAGASSRVT